MKKYILFTAVILQGCCSNLSMHATAGNPIEDVDAKKRFDKIKIEYGDKLRDNAYIALEATYSNSKNLQLNNICKNYPFFVEDYSASLLYGVTLEDDPLLFFPESDKKIYNIAFNYTVKNGNCNYAPTIGLLTPYLNANKDIKLILGKNEIDLSSVDFEAIRNESQKAAEIASKFGAVPATAIAELLDSKPAKDTVEFIKRISTEQTKKNVTAITDTNISLLKFNSDITELNKIEVKLSLVDEDESKEQTSESENSATLVIRPKIKKTILFSDRDEPDLKQNIDTYYSTKITSKNSIITLDKALLDINKMLVLYPPNESDYQTYINSCSKLDEASKRIGLNSIDRAALIYAYLSEFMLNGVKWGKLNYELTGLSSQNLSEYRNNNFFECLEPYNETIKKLSNNKLDIRQSNVDSLISEKNNQSRLTQRVRVATERFIEILHNTGPVTDTSLRNIAEANVSFYDTENDLIEPEDLQFLIPNIDGFSNQISLTRSQFATFVNGVRENITLPSDNIFLINESGIFSALPYLKSNQEVGKIILYFSNTDGTRLRLTGFTVRRYLD